ncbi:MAG: type II toxin-antitoxin system PemK/MazF family toxin [Candidatus Woesearchaeota archaeon]
MGRPIHPIVKRGDIWLADLEPGQGQEVRKIRPVLIVQNDVGNKFSSTTIIAPLTTQELEKIDRFEVKIEQGIVKEKSKILLNHIRAVDKCRLIKRFANLPSETMGTVDQALVVSLGLVAET